MESDPYAGWISPIYSKGRYEKGITRRSHKVVRRYRTPFIFWFTDPPYYDNIPYADLSDFFYVWLKRSLIGDSFIKNSSHFNAQLTQKDKEIVWN